MSKFRFYMKRGWFSFSFFHFIDISLVNPRKEIKQLKKVFKPLKWHFRFEINRYAPDPVLYCREATPIQIKSNHVTWKDKYDTPRYECCPYIWIHLFRLNFVWYYNSGDIFYDDTYWEQALWYLYYCNKNIDLAKSTWPWTFNGKSSWSDGILLL